MYRPKKNTEKNIKITRPEGFVKRVGILSQSLL